MVEKVPSSGDLGRVVRSLLSQGVDGVGPLCSSTELANEYRFDEGYRSTQARVDALIRWETAKNFGTGFITGLGGLVTLPATIPSSLYASYFLQARLAGAIAVLHGHRVEEDRVRTMILLCLLGNAGKEVLKDIGVKAGNRLAVNAIQKFSGKTLTEINKRVGFRLFAKTGEKGVINLTKVVPVAGGVVGGTIDAVACRVVGRTADKSFKK